MATVVALFLGARIITLPVLDPQPAETARELIPVEEISFPPVPPELVRRLADNSAPGGSAPPLMLAYHDIDPRARDLYSLTPAAFAAEMRLLAEAGYRSVRGAELLAWVQGRPLPPKSVFLSFDDGYDGVWQYAHPILARYGFTGTAFLITSYLGRDPGRMTWDQVRELARTGRWEIESHTRDGHRYLYPTPPAGGIPKGKPTAGPGTQPFLVSPAWLADQNRQETMAEYQERVTVDLTGSITDLEEHGLPRSALFAFPYGEWRGDDPRITEFLTGLTRQLFPLTMVSGRTGISTTSAEFAERRVRRLTAVSLTSLEGFVEQVIQATPLPLRAGPLSLTPESWSRVSGTGSFTVDQRGIQLQAPAQGQQRVAYHARRSAFWRDYGITATLTDLPKDPDATVGLAVHADAPQRPVVLVSSRSLTVKLQGSSTVLRQQPLPSRPTHRVLLAVYGSRLVVGVDDQPAVSIPLSGTVASGIGSGGPTVSLNADQTPTSVRVSDLTVIRSRSGDSPGTREE